MGGGFYAVGLYLMVVLWEEREVGSGDIIVAVFGDGQNADGLLFVDG